MVREKWPDLKLALHLHDTRGTGMANALMGHADGYRQFRQFLRRPRRLSVRRPQGRGRQYLHRRPRVHGEEMGIETGIDLDALIECARMAEDIVGHPLPGKVMHGGSLSKYRSGARHERGSGRKTRRGAVDHHQP